MSQPDPPNPVTTCVICSQADDHPKHLRILNDGMHTGVRFHHDCHAAASPPCPVCVAIMEGGGAEKTGEALRTFLLDGGADHASTNAVLAAAAKGGA